MEEILEVSSTLTASTNDISVRVKYDKFIKGRKIAKNGSSFFFKYVRLGGLEIA